MKCKCSFKMNNYTVDEIFTRNKNDLNNGMIVSIVTDLHLNINMKWFYAV